MVLISADVNPELLDHAGKITGLRSEREILTLALKELVAKHQKTSMVDGISRLNHLASELGVTPQKG